MLLMAMPVPLARWAFFAATSGPGATNLKRGCHGSDGLDPNGDRHWAGALAAIGTDAFQETDIYGITLPLSSAL